ncbi:MAG: aldehyde dehydrogenase family protein [Planctomycetota bacterium]
MSMNLQSRNPANGEVVWDGPISTPTEVDQAISNAHAYLPQWRSVELAERIKIVRSYAAHLTEHRTEVADLIRAEVGKLPWDAAGEVGASIAKAELSIKALQERRSLQVVEDDQAVLQRVTRYAPVGVALVLGPFNFPLHLPGGQIIPALLSGNTIVFKPSDQATAVGQWMMNAWRSVGLPDGAMQCVVGGVETATKAIDSSLINAVYLTGSLQAGRAIHRQLAGRPEVLLALELGGNNPVVVCEDAEPKKAASLVAFSAFISAGQRCTCARRALFVQGHQTEQQIDALIASTKQLRIGLASDQPVSQVGPLISADAANRLEQTYQRLLELGCQPIIPWRIDDRCRALVAPAIVNADGISDEARQALGEMEWFGPLLVIETVSTLEKAIQFAANTTYGLAASMLGGSLNDFEKFVEQVGAGVVNWNGPTTGAAGSLPFGGLGSSGNHRPAGFHAIDFCNDPVASLQRTEMPDLDPWSIAK